jgi:hypothetical protein
MISPTICAPNSELVSDSGMTEDASAGPLPGLAWLPATGLGTAEGLICGNRLDALPAGMVVESPGTPTPEPSSGIGPSGSAEPRVELFPVAPGTVAFAPLGDGVDEELPGAALLVALALGVGDALATVTVGAVAVAVSGEPLPLGTETVAENLIVSPAGAVLGTLT